MHLFSLLLGGTALAIGIVAVSVAAVIDFRDRDHRARRYSNVRRRAPHAGPPTAHLWNLSSVGRSSPLADDLVSPSQSGPDIIIGPWEVTPVSIDEQRREAA